MPSVIGALISILYYDALTNDLNEIPHVFQSAAYRHYYSLFIFLMMYGLVRVMAGFDFYVLRFQLYKINWKWLTFAYIATFMILTWVSIYFPRLYVIY